MNSWPSCRYQSPRSRYRFFEGMDGGHEPCMEGRPTRRRCHDLIVILDGDKGRDWGRIGHPIRADAQRVLDKLTDAGVDYWVLERYGIENYFSQTACETVLAQGLAGRFPLPAYTAVTLPNLTKNLNPQIARQMTLADIANTDLHSFLETIEARSGV